MKSQIKHPTDLLFACAAYAARINGGYCKVAEFGKFDPVTGEGREITRQTNKLVLLEALEHERVLTDEDRETGRLARQFCQGLILRQLAHGRLSEFHQKMMDCSNEDETLVANAGVIAYAPIMYQQSVKQELINDRLHQAVSTHIASPGTKVKLNIEVIRSNYSQQYGCNFITAITDENQAVFFSFKTPLELNQKYSIQGKVKSHKPNGQTQLNYVKI